MSDTNQRIEELVAEFLNSLLAGAEAEPLRAQLVRENPELAPELDKQLAFVESIVDTVGSRGRISPPSPSAPTPIQQERVRTVECPHCGNRLNLVSRMQPEVTCTSCGSVVTVDNELSATVSTLQTPRQIGRFRIKSFLGSGGFGMAYRAKDPSLDRMVAIKVPRAGQFITDTELERFVREARNAAKLRHANIVSVFEINTDEVVPFIVSEFIDGVTLSERVNAHRLPPKEIAQVMSIVCGAVHFAHSQGIIHRDLKLSNIFLDMENNPYVADFGLARNLDADYTMTLDGEVLGTPAYMSPEQASGQLSQVDVRSDVYSLGVMLYRMLCCEHPFRGSARMMLHQVMHEEPRSPRSIDVNIPVDLETITLKAMQKNPDNRYATAADVAEDLNRWLADRPILATPESLLSKFRRWRRRNPQTAVLVGVIAMLMVMATTLSAIWAVKEQQLKNAATAQARAAEEHALSSSRRLSASFVQNGLRGLEVGAHAKALMWFAAALDAEVDAETVHRTRIGMVLNRHPKLVALHSAGSPIRRLLVPQTGDFVVAGLQSGAILRFELDSEGVPLATMSHDAMVIGIGANAATDRLISRHKQQQSALLWNLRSGQRIAELKHSAVVTSVQMASDGKLAASADQQGVIKIWNPHDGALLFEFSHRPGELQVQLLDGMRLLSYVKNVRLDKTSKLAIWKLELASAEQQFEIEANIALARVDESAQLIIVASRDGTLGLRSVENGELKHGPFQHDGILEDCYIEADELVTVQHSGTITRWSINGARLDLVRHPTGIIDSTIDKRRRLLAIAGSDGDVSVYLRRSLDRIGPSLPIDETISAIAFQTNGRRLVGGGKSGVIRIWDLAGLAPDVPLLQHDDIVNVARFSPDGKRVISCSRDHSSVLWNSRNGSLIARLNHQDDVTDCQFSSDGRLAATCSLDATARLWDGVQGVKLGNPLSHASSLVRLRFKTGTPDTLITAATDGAVAGWNAVNQRRIFESKSSSNNISALEVDPQGAFFLTGAIDGALVVRRPEDGLPISPPLMHRDVVTRCGVTPSGDSIWTCSRDNSIRFWGARGSYSLEQELGFRGWPTNVAFSPSGGRFAVSNYSGHLTLWQGKTLLWRFARRRHFFKHCEIDPTGRFALVCGGTTLSESRRLGAGRAYLVDLATGLLAAPPLDHFGAIERAFFDASGQRLLTASNDHTARIWEIGVDERNVNAILLHAKALSGKSLNSAEQLITLEPSQQVDAFQDAKKQSPKWFECDARQIRNWEDYLAWVVGES